MSETTTTTPETTTGSGVNVIHATLDAAKAAVPATDRKSKPKLYAVSKAGSATRYLWAFGANDAMRAVAEADGYGVGVAEPKVAVSKEAVAAKLAAFSDDELAALGLARRKAPRK